MSTLFEPITINSMQMRNRFVRSATNDILAGEDGRCKPELVESMAELARGGVGLIISGFAYVNKIGQAMPMQIGCHSDEMLPGLAGIAQAVHQEGGAIALQVAHAGILAATQLSGSDAIGPSVYLEEAGPLGRPMSVGEIDETVQAFAAAASRGVQAGYDAVQIHGAHGYALSEFLSPLFNTRTDDYGGSIENRARVLLRVVGAVREAVGDNYPVLVKINSQDQLDGGLTPGDMVQACTMLEAVGVDAIELSGGTSYVLRTGEMERSWAPTQNKTVYWRDAAEQYKQEVGVPLMLVGGIRSVETAQELVDGGVADFVSMCRPFVRAPDLINRWESGASRVSECISCNNCGYATFEGQALHCVHL